MMRRLIKCVVWDLDDTLWQGTLLEGDNVVLKPGVTEVIRALDECGILQSVASKNDFAAAWERLVAFGLDEYFLHPQIGWANKSDSVQVIAERLGIAVEAIALVDDQPFERDEVRFKLPDVMTIDGADADKLLQLEALQWPFVTSESKLRRRMYQADVQRKQNEAEFAGTRDEFLATLAMVVTIRIAGEQDLLRAEELTIRTNQLNATGRTYSYDELHILLASRSHLLLVAELTDRYGASGTIGLALIERGTDDWLLKLLIMSCRVMSRGLGGIMIGVILRCAKHAGVSLRAEYVPTGRNRMMYVTYKFNGFFEVGEQGGVIVLEHPLDSIRPPPKYITVHVPNQH